MQRQPLSAQLDERVHHALAHPPVLVSQDAHQLGPELLIRIGDAADDLRGHAPDVHVAASQEPDHRPRDVELALHGELLEHLGGAVAHRDLIVRERLHERRKHRVAPDRLQRVQDRDADDAGTRAHLPLQRRHHAHGVEAAQPVHRRLHHGKGIRVEEDADVLEPVVLAGERGEGEDGLDDDRLLLLLCIQQGRDCLQGRSGILAHHRGVAEVLEGVHLFLRRTGQQGGPERWDGLVSCESHQHVHGLDASREARLAHRTREQLENRPATAQLLQRPRHRRAQSRVRRAEVLDQSAVLGGAVYFWQQRRERRAQAWLRRFQRLHEWREERLVRVLVDQAREHRQARAMNGRVRRLSGDDVEHLQQLGGLRSLRRGDERLHLVGRPPRRSLELVKEVLPRDHRRSPA